MSTADTVRQAWRLDRSPAPAVATHDGRARGPRARRPLQPTAQMAPPGARSTAVRPPAPPSSGSVAASSAARPARGVGAQSARPPGACPRPRRHRRAGRPRRPAWPVGPAGSGTSMASPARAAGQSAADGLQGTLALAHDWPVVAHAEHAGRRRRSAPPTRPRWPPRWSPAGTSRPSRPSAAPGCPRLAPPRIQAGSPSRVTMSKGVEMKTPSGMGISRQPAKHEPPVCAAWAAAGAVPGSPAVQAAHAPRSPRGGPRPAAPRRRGPARSTRRRAAAGVSRAGARGPREGDVDGHG